VSFEKNLLLFADAGVRFGPDFLRDHAGQIITDPRIAMVELIANAYDAGATMVRMTWPAESGEMLEIQDNGTGMTAEQFDRRWRTLNYKRVSEQGPYSEWPQDASRKHQRIAFGQNGKGRHGAFCFADIYHVETWKDGKLTRARVEFATNGGPEPFLSTVEDGGARAR
jgi:HSP90 family molecular chaperone